MRIRLDKSFKPIFNLTCLRTKNEDALVFPYCNQPNFFGKWDPVVTNCFSARKFKACTISQWGEQNSEKGFICFMQIHFHKTCFSVFMIMYITYNIVKDSNGDLAVIFSIVQNWPTIKAGCLH